ncbi:hypothetical protein H4S06_006912, partial [Coemansia sp. BCRC 34490]
MDPNSLMNNTSTGNGGQASSSGGMGAGASGGSGGDLGLSLGLDDIWGMSDATNLFFNMDAFSSAPSSAIGNGAAASSTMMGASALSSGAAASLNPQQQQQQMQVQQNQQNQAASATGIDLSSLGFDMGGSSMDPEAWRMLLQGDPSMDDLFGSSGSFGSGVGASASLTGSGIDTAHRLANNNTAPAATLVPADLDALSRN